MLGDIFREIFKVRWCTFQDLIKKTFLSIIIIAFVAAVFIGYDLLISLIFKLFA